MNRIKFFFWKLFNPLKLIGSKLERTWYFKSRGKYYEVTLFIEKWDKTTYYWKVVGPRDKRIRDRDLENYLIEKARENLKEEVFKEVRD